MIESVRFYNIVLSIIKYHYEEHKMYFIIF